MNPRMTKLSIALAQALGVGLAASVTALPAMAQQPVAKERIEVTGSNIKRIEGETALPVTVISREEIQKTGVTTVAELLEKLPASSGGNFGLAQGAGNNDPGRATVSLRGLGETNTLILLNGRRLSIFPFNSASGGAVDLNQIPISAIERVEILKDGASAIYSTDAIAGVINFILRKDYTGLEVSAYGTHTQHGGGNVRRYTGTFGFGDLDKQRFNVLLNLDYQKDDPLKASQRLSFTGTGIRPDMGFAQTSGRTFPANFSFGALYNLTARTGCLPDQGSYRINGAGDPDPLRRSCRQDYSAVLDIYPPAERKGAFVRGAFQFTKDHQAFVEYLKQKNEVTFAVSETPVVSTGGEFLNVPYIYPANGRYYPGTFVDTRGNTITPTGDLPFNWRAKPAGRRTERVDSDQDRLVGGLQGVLVGWDYNTAVYESRSKATDNYLDGWLNDTILRRGVATGNIDVFSGRPLDAAGLALLDAAKVLGKVRDSESKVSGVDGKFSKDLMELKSGPMSLAVGFDHRKEELRDTPAPVITSGNVIGAGGDFKGSNADRKVTALFGELSIPILKSLEAQLAVRYDKYSDFGNTTNPKVALRWTPTKELLLRTSYSTGFRAPTLPDLNNPQFVGNTNGSHSDPLRCTPDGLGIGPYVDASNECDIQVNARVGGNPALQPEKSRQWSLGAIFEPTQMVSVGTDFWTIHRRNSINTVGDSTIFDVYGAQDPLTANGYFVRQARTSAGGCVGDIPGTSTPSSVPCAIAYVIQLQQNLGKYNVTGQDFTASVRFAPTSWGQFTLKGDGTYFYSYRYQIFKDAPYSDNHGIYTTDNGAVSRWQHYVSLNWRAGPWGATLSQHFVLGYHDDEGNGNPPRRVAPYEIYDLQGTWGGWKGFSVAAGIRNLFDRDPPASAASQNFQVGYDARYADPHGRTYYATLKYTFK